MTFLYFIFAILVVVWFMGLIVRASISRWFNKRTEEFNRAAREAQREAKRRNQREGDVTIESTGNAAPKRVSKNVGDYVDFEEVSNSDTK